MGLRELGYKPRETTVRILLDDSVRRGLLDAAAGLAAQHKKEKQPGQGLGSKVPDLETELEEANAAADEAAVSFTFKALGRRKFKDLVNACPPTPETLERWKNTRFLGSAPEFELEKFMPRLVAASLVEPQTSESEVVELWEDPDEGWSDAVWAELYDAAWKVNQEVSTLPT